MGDNLLENNLLKVLLQARKDGKVELSNKSSVTSRLLEMGYLQYLEDAQGDITDYYILTDNGRLVLNQLYFSGSEFHAEALNINNYLLPHEQRQSIQHQIASTRTKMHKFRAECKTRQDWVKFRCLRSLVKKQEVEQLLWEIYIADQPVPLIYQVAEAFHFAVCSYNHTDGCSWYYNGWDSKQRQIHIQLINELAKTDDLGQWLAFLSIKSSHKSKYMELLNVDEVRLDEMFLTFDSLKHELKANGGI